VVETLESVKAQTYQNIELIVSDDCSMDDTVDICREWLDKNAERFCQTELVSAKINGGIGTNCNRGLRIAKGEWIKFFAGDDILLKGSIQGYLDHIKIHDEIEVLHGRVQQFKDEFTSDNKIKSVSRNKVKFNMKSTTPAEQFQILLRNNAVQAPSVFIKKSVFEKVGGFHEEFKMWEDRPMWLKITQNNIKMHYLDKICAKYRIHANSVQLKKKEYEVYPRFVLERDKHLITNYGCYLPPIERYLKTMNLRRKVIIEKLYAKIPLKGIKAIISLIDTVFDYSISRIDRKYSIVKNSK